MSLILTSDLLSRIILPWAYLLYYLSKESEICMLGRRNDMYHFGGHCDLDLASKIIVWSKLVLKLISQRWQYVVFHFWITVTLTYDLLSRITIFWSISSILFEVGIWCVDLSWDGGEVHTIWGHFGLDMTSDIISRFSLSGAYLLYYK